MSNTILTPTVVTREIGVILHNNMPFCRSINRQYDNSHQMTGQRDGGSIKLRLPNQYTTSTGAALDIQDTTETSRTLNRTTQRHVDMNFSTAELTQNLDDFSERILMPATTTLASNIDYDAMSMVTQVGNSVGTPGTTPATALVWLQAGAKLSDFATPASQRSAVLDPNANASTVDGLSGLFHSSADISKQNKTGFMAMNVLGIGEWAMSQNVRDHTTGSGAATSWLVDEPSGTNLAEGSRILDMDGGSASETLLAGDVFTIAGVYSVNPETKKTNSSLQQFVVTNAATASSGQITGGTGTGQLQFWPPLYSSSSGALQNISEMPSNNDAVTVVGSASTVYPQNVVYHKDAFVLATTDLEMPDGVDFKAREVVDDISIRVVRQYRIGNDDIPCRCDVLYGYVAYRREMAARVWG